MTTEPVRHELWLAAPVAAVWAELREPSRIMAWHGWEDPGLEAEVQQLYVDLAEVDEEGCDLVLGGHRIRLEDAPDEDGDPGTLLRLTRTPPRGEHQLDWEQVYDDIDEGWATFLHTLRFRLERHPDDARRTGFWWGRTIDEYGPRPVRALGLDLLDDLQPGDPYAAVAATGDELAGEVWFRTPHQIGITVDAWGDGLLVLAESPTIYPPHAAAMAVLSTYGLAEPEREALLGRFDKAWDAEYTAEPLPT